MRSHFAIVFSCLLFGASALATPAPWYLWRSKLDGQVFCAQTPPGVGWQRVGGPYRDARCENTGVPGK
ncbi:MAG: hypothetical protein DVS81_03455 [Candidatus Accumulibacter meliphilus]|uniref:DUF4124 domain-containing protein n=1 Tax=Candidatus Accumulibacter meliphilus TaxID=2211374 RepID=A0A369XPD5_9PROT|nr:MAG: hypothetical protein DVS81_03455 [Candidatus Accumulibacter meliphilus]